jgi:hypothetical protein
MNCRGAIGRRIPHSGREEMILRRWLDIVRYAPRSGRIRFQQASRPEKQVKVKKWHWGAVLAYGVISALPIPVRARQIPSAGVRLEQPGSSSELPFATSPAAAVQASAPDSSAPAAAAGGSPPAWPTDSGGIFGRFREDLSKPLTTKQKLTRAIRQALFPGIIGAAAASGLGMAADTRLDRDYGMGGRGFVRRWGSAFGQNAVGVFVGDFAFASALHQDPRYHPDKKKGFGHRLGHALAAVVVTPSDSGRNEFNSSHLLGIAVASGASTAWHHHSDRNARLFGERFGYDVAISAFYNVVSEFLFYRKEPRN